MSPFTLLRLADRRSDRLRAGRGAGAAEAGLDGAEDATGDDGMRTAPATGGTAALASAARPSSAARTRKTISVGLTRSMRTVPPSWGRSVARPGGGVIVHGEWLSGHAAPGRRSAERLSAHLRDCRLGAGRVGLCCRHAFVLPDIRAWRCPRTAPASMYARALPSIGLVGLIAPR